LPRSCEECIKNEGWGWKRCVGIPDECDVILRNGLSARNFFACLGKPSAEKNRLKMLSDGTMVSSMGPKHQVFAACEGAWMRIKMVMRVCLLRRLPKEGRGVQVQTADDNIFW